MTPAPATTASHIKTGIARMFFFLLFSIHLYDIFHHKDSEENTLNHYRYVTFMCVLKNVCLLVGSEPEPEPGLHLRPNFKQQSKKRLFVH
jgi:hypothetical protein